MAVKDRPKDLGERLAHCLALLDSDAPVTAADRERHWRLVAAQVQRDRFGERQVALDFELEVVS